MELHVAFGFLAAFGWAISSVLWIVSTRIQLGIKAGDPTRASDFTNYFAKVGKWNSWAGAISAASAGASAVSLFIQNMPKPPVA